MDGLVLIQQVEGTQWAKVWSVNSWTKASVLQGLGRENPKALGLCTGNTDIFWTVLSRRWWNTILFGNHPSREQFGGGIGVEKKAKRGVPRSKRWQWVSGAEMEGGRVMWGTWCGSWRAQEGAGGARNGLCAFTSVSSHAGTTSIRLTRRGPWDPSFPLFLHPCSSKEAFISHVYAVPLRFKVAALR